MSLMIKWTKEQLREAGIDPKKVASIARRLTVLSHEMRQMDLYVWGANGTGHLIHRSRPPHVDTPGINGGLPDFGASITCVGTGFDGGDW